MRALKKRGIRREALGKAEMIGRRGCGGCSDLSIYERRLRWRRRSMVGGGEAADVSQKGRSGSRMTGGAAEVVMPLRRCV